MWRPATLVLRAFLRRRLFSFFFTSIRSSFSSIPLYLNMRLSVSPCCTVGTPEGVESADSRTATLLSHENWGNNTIIRNTGANGANCVYRAVGCQSLFKCFAALYQPNRRLTLWLLWSLRTKERVYNTMFCSIPVMAYITHFLHPFLSFFCFVFLSFLFSFVLVSSFSLFFFSLSLSLVIWRRQTCL
jgi:hypothetical protein